MEAISGKDKGQGVQFPELVVRWTDSTLCDIQQNSALSHLKKKVSGNQRLAWNLEFGTWNLSEAS